MTPKHTGGAASGLRVLGRVRLSRESGETGTGLDRQRESIEQWAALQGHQIIGWAVDDGVSGSVDPFKAPSLGPWLTEERLGEWDLLVAYRLDRLSRSTIHTNRLIGWATERGKAIASATEGIDLSNSVGRLIAHVISFLAEGELEAISERNRSSQAKLRQLGRWHGSGVPYGFQPEKRSDGWYLVHQPDEVRILREEILPRVLRRESARSIAESLNAKGLRTRKGPWHVQSVLAILKSRALLGQHEHKGKLVVDDDGLPVQRAEPLVTADEWAKIQAALSSRSIRTGERNQDPLTGVLFCHRCGAAVYAQRMTGREYAYYRCSARGATRCGAGSLKSDLVIELIEERLLAEIGSVPRRERVYVAGTNHTEALEAVQTALRAARKEFDLGLYDGTEDEYFERLQRLSARRKELESLPSQPSGFEWRDVGETWGQTWQRMDAAERRTLMLDSGIRFTVAGGVGNQVYSHLDIPEDVRDRIEK